MDFSKWKESALLYLLVLGAWVMQGCTHAKVTAVDRPNRDAGNTHYISNRTPLKSSVLVKLPIGSIEPEGWLKKQLQLQAEGFHGHLGEISPFLKKENNSWLSSTGEGSQGVSVHGINFRQDYRINKISLKSC